MGGIGVEPVLVCGIARPIVYTSCRLSACDGGGVGARQCTGYGARHTSGSSYAVMGVGQRVIATLLGHADVGTTQRYTHVDAVSATQPLVEERWRRLNGPR